jgi:hypothetical protein
MSCSNVVLLLLSKSRLIYIDTILPLGGRGGGGGREEE